MHKISLLIIFVFLLLTGCVTSSKVVLHPASINQKEVVTVYVPQAFIKKVNGKSLTGIDISDVSSVELIELSSGNKSFEARVESHIDNHISHFKSKLWRFKYEIDLKPGHVYFIYWEEKGEEISLFARDLGPIRDEFNPVLNEFGFVEGGRDALIKRRIEYYNSLKIVGESIEIKNIKNL